MGLGEHENGEDRLVTVPERASAEVSDDLLTTHSIGERTSLVLTESS
ncbi:MAG: hypothetical protein ACI9CV_000210 [Ilumatobacter sp.]|jgi:hypothetical protein